MNLREYIKELTEFAAEHPEYLDLDVIYAKDEEGNDFYDIYNDPTPFYYDGDDDEYYDEENFNEEYEREFIPNVICIN